MTTVRALKHHGGIPDGGLEAVERGAANLERHIGIVRGFGLPPIVAVNRRPEDTDEECDLVRRLALDFGAHGAEMNEAFEKGGEGAAALAEAVVDAAEQPNDFHYLYALDAPIERKSRRSRPVSTSADGRELPAPRRARRSSATRRTASTGCRSAWPRRTSRCPTIRSS